jgi:LPS sulfotransferase NodH
MASDLKKIGAKKEDMSAKMDVNAIRRDVKQLKELRLRLSTLNLYFADEEIKKTEIDVSNLITETIGILDQVVTSLEPYAKKPATETSQAKQRKRGSGAHPFAIFL